MTRIAIIGAGLAGLTLARELGGRADVVLFEKSAHPGGRIATRDAGPYCFDHGAQFFVARTAAFRRLVETLVADGVVKPWHARFAEFNGPRIASQRVWDDSHPHYVATPGMNRLGKHLANGLDIRLNTTVDGLTRKNGDWRLSNTRGKSLGNFDWVVSTAPAAQSAKLLPDSFVHHERLHKTDMLGCYALMLGFEQPLSLAWDAALVRNADISWISVNSRKPGRGGAFTLVVHSTNRWAEQHLDDDDAAVVRHMLAEAGHVTGLDLTQADYCQLKRWRYANIEKQAAPNALVDEAQRLAACGDWCIRGRVEAAYTSAIALASMLPIAVI